jgi:hypothetical protein
MRSVSRVMTPAYTIRLVNSRKIFRSWLLVSLSWVIELFFLSGILSGTVQAAPSIFGKRSHKHMSDSSGITGDCTTMRWEEMAIFQGSLIV